MGGPHVKTRRHSKVSDELPREIKSEVDSLLIEGATYEDISVFLKGKGHDISKSSIGRYGKDYLNAYQRLRIIEDQSRTLVSEADSELTLEVAGGKLMAQKIIEILLQQDVDTKKIPDLAIGLASIIKANVSREKFKTDLKKKITKTADDVTTIAKRSGLSDDAAAQIRAKILGITQ
jgi:hypothetical protein